MIPVSTPVYRIKSTGCIRLSIMNGWSDWPENYRCLIIQSIFRYVHILRLLHNVYMSIFCTFTTTPLIALALLCRHNNSQLQLQSSCRKDESSIFKKDTNYVHWMYEVHWPSVPVSGGGGAELTETRRPVSTLQSPLPWTPLWNLSVAAASSEQHHAPNTSVSMYKLWFTVL